MKRALFPAWTVPLALLLLCAISYGIMASKLGVHMDDWKLLWLTHFLGPSAFKEAFSVDRPSLGWLYGLTTSLLGESPLNWQVFGIFTRWLGCLALWWGLKALWPHKLTQVTAISFLFAVYPGFISLYIPVTYAHHIFILAVTLFSLGALNWALRQPNLFWPFYLGSLALGGYALFTMEYYFGLELLRPVFLWLILGETVKDARQRLKRTGLLWTPYLTMVLLFLVWRISTPTPRGSVTTLNELGTELIPTALELGKTIVQDIFEASALAWIQTLDFSIISAFERLTILKYSLIIVGTALLATIYLALLRSDHHAEMHVSPGSRRRWARQAILLGLYALLLGGIPAWMTNWRISLAFPQDRFTMAMMLGASLLLMGLIELMSNFRVFSILIAGVCVGMAAGMHFQVALTYRQEWLLQKDFFWQLAWRAPGIQPGTAILMTEIPFTYNSGYSITAPLNWTYAPELVSSELPYLVYDIELYHNDLGDLSKPGMEALDIDVHMRTTSFSGSTSQALVVFYRPPACLRAINPLTDRLLPDKPRYYRELLPLSNIELIQTDADQGATPPAYYFGAEPEHDWCYYFEKAELARQVGNWEQVVSLGDQALRDGKKFYRKNVPELVPFIEGYARLGHWDRAVQLSLESHQVWANMNLTLCDAWERIRQAGALDEGGQAAYEEIQEALRCAAP